MRQLIERHLADAKLGIKTRINYRSQADKHIIPCIGQRKVRAVDANITDSFLNAERNLLQTKGWTYDPKTTLWSPGG